MPQAEEGQQYYVNDELFPTMVCFRTKWPIALWLCSALYSSKKSTLESKSNKEPHANVFRKYLNYNEHTDSKQTTQTGYGLYIQII